MFVTGGKQLLVEPRALQKREEPVGSANRDWLNLEIDEHSHACLSYPGLGVASFRRCFQDLE